MSFSAAVITFPGSNCDRDMADALEKVSGSAPLRVWHGDAELPERLDFIALPGGFSYGDDLRSGAMAARSPIMRAVVSAAARGVPVLVDGAQATPHMRVDVQDLDCDFYAFSGHKLCGPTGIGILYGKAAILERMQPFKGGGDMILSVTFEKTTYNTIPHKFEAGTPPIAAAITLGAAVDYLSAIGMDQIAAHEIDLLNYATEQVNGMPGVRIIGTAEKKAAVLSFAIEGVHPHDVGTLLNQDGIAIRTGHHCAQPVMQRFKVPATSRASFAFYNNLAEVDALIAGIRNVQKVFA